MAIFNKTSFSRKKAIAACALLSSLLMLPSAGFAQDAEKPEDFKAMPILTGSTAYFSRVNGGVVQDAPSVSPLILWPLGDKWLIEVKGNFSDTIRKDSHKDFGGLLSYGVSYMQVDYIANRYATVTFGRFIAPFGVYGERYAPNWIRALQPSPLIGGVYSGSAAGGMVRGGFSVTRKLNLNYASYFSTNNTNHILATDRSAGGRIGMFIPAARLEVGTSFQQLLQADRSYLNGMHFIWQPYRLPVAVRSEYARSSGIKGSGYWVESTYRLFQVPHLDRVELVGRAQQFFAASHLTKADIKKLGSLGKDKQEADFGLNYYFNRDVRGSFSYGRQLGLGQNANLWSVGVTYRFMVPLGRTGMVQ